MLFANRLRKPKPRSASGLRKVAARAQHAAPLRTRSPRTVQARIEGLPNVLVFQPHLRSQICTILVGLEARRADPVCSELLITLLGIASDANRAEQLAAIASDQHAAALRKDLIARSTNEVLHEERPFFRAHPNERR